MFVYFLFVCIFLPCFQKVLQNYLFLCFLFCNKLLLFFGTSTKPAWVHFYFTSCIWGLTPNCSLLGSFISPLCLRINFITQWMILWQYVIVYLAIILFGCFLFPKLLSTCCSSFSNFSVSFWQSMSNVYFWCFHYVLSLVI